MHILLGFDEILLSHFLEKFLNYTIMNKEFSIFIKSNKY